MPERWTLSETTVALPGGTVSIMAQLNDGETEFAVFFEATAATGPPSLLHRWVHFVPRVPEDASTVNVVSMGDDGDFDSFTPFMV